MRVMARRAVLGGLTAVGGWTQIFRFVVTFNARFQDRHPQKSGSITTMRLMADRAFSRRHRRMADLFAEIARMTLAALIQQVRSNLHSPPGIMATAALA